MTVVPKIAFGAKCFLAWNINSNTIFTFVMYCYQYHVLYTK